MAISAQTSYGASPTAAPNGAVVSHAPTVGAATPKPAATPAAPASPERAAALAGAGTAAPKVASAALPAVSQAKPPTFQGIDPSQQWSGAQLLTHLNKTFGQDLNADQRTEAMKFLNYSDPTGAAMIGGADVNRLLEYSAGRSGGQYNPYTAPPPVDPAQQPYQTSNPSTAVAAPKPPTFQGIDPSQQWSGVQLLDHLNKTFGQDLNADQRTEAMKFLNYSDPTGAAMIGGADVNRLLEYSAGRSGGQYNPYAAPPPVDPAQQPYPTSGPLPPQTINAPPVEAAPAYTAPTYQRQTFRAPTYEEAQNDPGYRFARDEGIGAIQASAAARGMLGTGTTMRDLSRFNQDLASQQYQTVYNRNADTFDRNSGESRFGYGAEVEGAQAEYAPGLVTWNARRDTGQRNAELNFDRAWQRETYGREDNWRRNRGAESDWQYRDNQAETRRRFLAELGQA